MRDGVRLGGEVHLDEDAPPRPALVYRTPYGREGCRLAYAPDESVGRGWTVLIQDVRGRFSSGGTFEPATQERHDGADTVAWCTSQPWCDGRVVMSGQSYIGLANWMCALERPPALRSIVARITSSDFASDIVYEDGALQLGWASTWALLIESSDERNPRARRELAERLANDPKAWRVPLGRSPLRRASPMFASWLDELKRWDGSRIASRRRWADVPVFTVTGWFDALVEGALRGYEAMRRRAPSARARNGQRLIVGPWAHGGEWQTSSGDIDFGPRAGGLKYAREIEGWMRTSVDADPPGGVSVFCMGSNRWIELDDWPPPAREESWFLGPGGTLDRRPPSTSASDGYRYDPGDPVPTIGGHWGTPDNPPGPREQSAVEARPDVLVYRSPPLDKPLTVMGTVRVRLWFSSSAASADLVARLVDVSPDGPLIGLMDSVRRLALTPGRTQVVEFALGTTAHTFRRRHRIGLHVTSSSFPQFDLNPSTGEPPFQAKRHRPANQRVHHGGRALSRLVLPLSDLEGSSC